jgi:hypothetical protein
MSESLAFLVTGIISFIAGLVIVLVFGWMVIDALPDPSDVAPPAWATAR